MVVKWSTEYQAGSVTYYSNIKKSLKQVLLMTRLFCLSRLKIIFNECPLVILIGNLCVISFVDARLFLFGSSKNGFGFRSSDIDICMTLENKVKEDVDCVDVIIGLSKLLKKHKDCGNVLAITTAKVPIVKFYLRSCKREADISLYNTLALENTKMLATYAKLDDRVATLGYTVKVFAKVSLNEGRNNLASRD